MADEIGKHDFETVAVGENKLLGIADLGFDADRLSTLRAELDRLNDSGYVETPKPKTQRFNFFTSQTGGVGESGEQNIIDDPSENVSLGTKVWIKRMEIESQIEDELQKKPDSLELVEAIEELTREGVDLKSSLGINADRVVVDKKKSQDFIDKDADAYLEEKKVKVANMVSGEIWFHTTAHLKKMIAGGGIATQSRIRRNDPEYFRLMSDNSSSKGRTNIDPKLSSPLNVRDSNMIFFSANSAEFYSDSLIAFAASDLVVDTGLYFYPEGHNHMGERVVSDLVDQDKDEIPQAGESDLLIAFDRAYLAVNKTDYKQTCKELLLAGYTKDWVEEHLFSYRGRGESVSKARKEAEKEIKRRISKRGVKSVGEIKAVANPDNQNLDVKVFQVRSKK